MTNTNTITKADAIDWDVVEGGNTEFTTNYPRMQWVHGDPKAGDGLMKKGGLFISEDIYPSFEATGFTADKLITEDGKEIAGYGASYARVAVIRMKLQWIVDDFKKNVPLVHALLMVNGCTDIINLSLKGAAKALPFQKAFESHCLQNVALANKSRPDGRPALEPFALWFPVRSGALTSIASKDGKATSKVTFPELSTPEKLDRDYVTKLWVGAENYKLFAQIYRDTADWQKLPIWKVRDAVDNLSDFDGLVSDRTLQELLALCAQKDVDEKDFCLQLTAGEWDSFEKLRQSEAKEALDRLKLI